METWRTRLLAGGGMGAGEEAPGAGERQCGAAGPKASGGPGSGPRLLESRGNAPCRGTWWRLSVQNVNHGALRLDGETLGSAACMVSSGIKHRPEAGIFQPLIKPTLPACGLPRRAKESGAPRGPRGWGHCDPSFRASAAGTRTEFLRQG